MLIPLRRRRGPFVVKFCSLTFTYNKEAFGRVSRRMDNSVLHPLGFDPRRGGYGGGPGGGGAAADSRRKVVYLFCKLALDTCLLAAEEAPVPMGNEWGGELRHRATVAAAAMRVRPSTLAPVPAQVPALAPSASRARPKRGGNTLAFRHTSFARRRVDCARARTTRCPSVSRLVRISLAFVL